MFQPGCQAGLFKADMLKAEAIPRRIPLLNNDANERDDPCILTILSIYINSSNCQDWLLLSILIYF